MQRNERFTKAERLRKRSEFRQVYEQGRRYHVSLFTVFVLQTAQDTNRLGVTVTKRIGRAVTRNRCKRLVREVFRRNKWRLPGGLDLVVNVKQSMVDSRYADVESDFLKFIQKLNANQPSQTE
jgi:ribonuclease P protein component